MVLMILARSRFFLMRSLGVQCILVHMMLLVVRLLVVLWVIWCKLLMARTILMARWNALRQWLSDLEPVDLPNYCVKVFGLALGRLAQLTLVVNLVIAIGCILLLRRLRR